MQKKERLKYIKVVFKRGVKNSSKKNLGENVNDTVWTYFDLKYLY